MAEAAGEGYLEPAARRVYEACTDEEREELDRLFTLIEVDPWVDGVVKVTVDMPPAVFVVYRHPRRRIAYAGPNRGRIAVIAIARQESGGSEPTWAR